MKLLTVKQTAEKLGISPRTIYNGIHRRPEKPFPIKPVRIGKLVRFREKDVRRYVKNL